MWYEMVWSGGRAMRVLWPASGLLWPAVVCLPWSACLLACSLSVSLSLSSSLLSLSLSVLALPSFWGSIRCRREMSRWRNPATCCQGTVWSRCRGGRVALTRLIRFRFGKAMGLSGAGPSPIRTLYAEPFSQPSQPAVSLSFSPAVLLHSSSCRWGTDWSSCCESVAHPFSPSQSGYSQPGRSAAEARLPLSPGPRCPCPLAVHCC